MCSSAAPSLYLPDSGSCSTKPTCCSVRRMPCTVVLGSSSAPASSTTPMRRDGPESTRRIAAARSIDWMEPGTVPGVSGALPHEPLGPCPLERPLEGLLHRRVAQAELPAGERAVVGVPVQHG